MKTFNKVSVVVVLAIAFGLTGLNTAHAVTPPDRGLGTADSYAVFGKAGVTNDEGGTTHIWGNVGADTLSTITGLVDSQVDGTIIAPAANVQTDASSTYDSLMSATQGTPTGLDLAGTNTIGPGVYDVAASTFNGALTLDGAGVYIFRSSSSNTTVGSGTMNLINGACASNIFWAISTSMTINAGAHVEGTIIASTGSITLGTGATLVGRAISLTQQVTLLLNQITQPTCEAASTPTAEENRDVDIEVVKTADPSVLSSGPGSVTFTYKVRNTGNVPLKNISVKDDKCSPVKYISGDGNHDSRLDTDERWLYTCTKVVSQTETNEVIAKGTNGKEVSDKDTAKVTVSTPGFPASGVSSDENFWDMISQKLISFFSF